MLQAARARTTIRRTFRPSGVPLAIVFAVIIGSLVYQSASSSERLSDEARWPGSLRALPQHPPSVAPALGVVPRGVPGRAAANNGALTEEDGVLPGGVTVFDDDYPGVTNLDPDLLRALRDAATHAANDGIEVDVSSGWRSADYQDRLLREAVVGYGSEDEAARWVATADTSPHVSGDAVDIGSADATAWLSDHGAGYGLCQIYRNERWHFELRPRAVDRGCPRMYADPTHDPRMGGP